MLSLSFVHSRSDATMLESETQFSHSINTTTTEGKKKETYKLVALRLPR